MPVPTSLNDLSTTPASNFPAGSDAPSTIDDTLRAHAALMATLRDNKLNASAVSAFGLTLLDDADAAAARTTLGVEPSFFVARANAVSWPTGSMTSIAGLFADSIDPSGFFTPATGVFKPNKPGMYFYSFDIQLTASVPGALTGLTVEVLKFGTQDASRRLVFASGSTTTAGVNVSSYIYLDGGATGELTARAQVDVSSGTATLPTGRFMAHRIGPLS